MTEEAEQHFKSAVKRFEQRLGKGSDDPFTKYYIACLYSLERRRRQGAQVSWRIARTVKRDQHDSGQERSGFREPSRGPALPRVDCRAGSKRTSAAIGMKLATKRLLSGPMKINVL